MEKIGIELGIRTPLNTIKKAAKIAEDSNKIDYFLVPETHPKFIGVDAFQTLEILSKDVHKIRIGTGIVNIFSRSENEILNKSEKIFRQTNGNFILGLGTSTPYIVEKMYKMKFKKPLTKLRDYTIYLKNHYKGPIFWGAVGDKTVKLAAKHADGVMFFLKQEDEINHSTEILNTELNSVGKSIEKFEVFVIRPVILDDSVENAEKSARISLASYFTGNEFYANPLAKSNYQKEIIEIREAFTQNGLVSAAEKVSEKMVKEFVTIGGVEECIKDLNEFSKRIKTKSIILGFVDLHSDENKNFKFLKNLEILTSNLKK